MYPYTYTHSYEINAFIECIHIYTCTCTQVKFLKFKHLLHIKWKIYGSI